MPLLAVGSLAIVREWIVQDLRRGRRGKRLLSAIRNP